MFVQGILNTPNNTEKLFEKIATWDQPQRNCLLSTSHAALTSHKPVEKTNTQNYQATVQQNLGNQNADPTPSCSKDHVDDLNLDSSFFDDDFEVSNGAHLNSSRDQYLSIYLKELK